MENSIGLNEITKNTRESGKRTLFEQNDQSLLIAENREEHSVQMASLITKSIIHFFFCLDGSAAFEFGPHYSREIQKQRNYFFFNPDKDLPFNLTLTPGTRMVFLNISLKSLHDLFVH